MLESHLIQFNLPRNHGRRWAVQPIPLTCNFTHHLQSHKDTHTCKQSITQGDPLTKAIFLLCNIVSGSRIYLLCEHIMGGYPSVRERDCVYLEPFLGLLLALHGQHQCISTGKRESELVLLPPAIFGHVDDGAQAEWYVCVG